MNNYIRARVLTNSLDDKYYRVRVSAEGFWAQSSLISSIGCIPLNVGDVVVVDVSCGFESPMIVGKFFDTDFKTNASEGQVIFESSDGNNWSVLSVKADKVILRNSKGMSMVFGDIIEFNDGKNKGTVLLEKLVENLNSILSYLSRLESATMAGIRAVGESSAASGTKGAAEFTSLMAGSKVELVSMENKKITQ